jgi:hypothetical protein
MLAAENIVIGEIHEVPSYRWALVAAGIRRQRRPRERENVCRREEVSDYGSMVQQSGYTN